MNCKECGRIESFVAPVWEDKWIRSYGKRCYYCAVVLGLGGKING